MTYRIVFLDVDGTITHHEDGSISNKTKEAIVTLKNKGIKVVAATGRPLGMCEEIRELGIDTLITANGAYAKHNQEVIHKVPIDKHIIQEVYEFAQEMKHGMSFFTEDFFMNGVKDPGMLKALKETLSLDDYPSIHHQIYQEEVYLMCLYGNDDMVKDYIKQFPHLTIKRWHPYVSNLLQKEVSKSLAIHKVLTYFDIKPYEAIAFGDGENDIDMLECVGLGIAMGNGHDQLKKVADFVTKKSSEDGIEFALKKFQII